MSLLKNPGRPAADGRRKVADLPAVRSRLGLRSDHPPVRAATARATSRGRWGQDRGRTADRRTGPAAPQHLGHRAADRPHRRRPRVHHRDVRIRSAIACYRVCYLSADHADEHGRNAVPRTRCRPEDAVEPARAIPPGVLRPPRRGARRGAGGRAQAMGAPRAQPLGAFGIDQRRRLAPDVGAPPRRSRVRCGAAGHRTCRAGDDHRQAPDRGGLQDRARDRATRCASSCSNSVTSAAWPGCCGWSATPASRWSARWTTSAASPGR